MIASFPSGPIATNVIVVSCPVTRSAVIIDPAAGSLDTLTDYVEREGLTVEKILVTHSHWDHIADCKACKETFDVPVYIHRLDAANLEEPGCDGVLNPLEHLEGVKADGFLDEGDVVQVGELELEVMHLPGHCPGHLGFYIERLGALISGDLVFAGGAIGTLALPTAEPEKMRKSLAKVRKLAPETIVYPGHGGTTTIGEERWEF